MPNSSSIQSLGNKLLILLIIIIIVTIPIYGGFVGAFVATYGPDAWKYGVNPHVMFQYYQDYLMPMAEQYGGQYALKIYGPPGAGVFMAVLTLFLMRAPLLDYRPMKKHETIHGDAKWADEGQIRAAKLRVKKGMLLGRTGINNYLVADDFQHVLLFAPTGSGKGVGFVIPNLLFWEESVVCHDIKMENYELTSGYRRDKMKQQVFVWNPADPNGVSHCYNPLDWISEKPGQMVDDVQKICNLVLPEQEFWQNEARSLLLGIILYLCAVPEKVTSFGEVVRTMRSDDVVYNLAVVLDTIGGKIHPVAYMNIASFLQKADKERSGVISTMNSGLELWANPLIDTTTASSDFDLQELKKQKMTVFVGVTPDNLQRLEPLLKIFYQQATDFLTRNMPTPEEKYGVMFMMDEFPSLGEMPQFQIGIAYFRGYRVKLFLIVQDTQQLKGIYEEAGMNSFLSNCYYRITFSANNIETANMISQLVGNKTVEQESHNKPKFLDMNPASRTMHVSEAQRALLLPQEVIQLPRDEQIILVESFSPIKCKKIFYYKDKFFTKRLINKIELPQQEPYDPRKKKKVAAPPPPPEEEKKKAAPPPPPPPSEDKKKDTAPATKNDSSSNQPAVPAPKAPNPPPNPAAENKE